MYRLTLRFIVGVLVAFLTISVLWGVFIFQRTNWAPSTSASTAADNLIFSMIEHSIQAGLDAKKDLPTLLEDFSKVIGQKAELCSIDDPDILPVHRQRLAEGKSVVRLEHSNSRIQKI